MKLSIVIPIYNTELYIKECILSILNEINDDVELILIDDGSTDNSRKICEEIKTKQIKIFSNTNHGVSYSRNFGLKKAKGEWILFVDSDDILRKGWFKKINKILTKGYDYIIFSENITNENELTKGELLKILVAYKKNNIYLSSPTSKLFRRKFLENNNILFKEEIINGEDMLFNLECLSKTNKYKFINQGIYNLRENINSSTKRFNKKIFESDMKFHKELNSIIENNIEFDNKSKFESITYSKKNAIITLAQRLSYSGDYKIFKENADIFKKYHSKDLDLVNIGLKKELILFLIKTRMYYLVYLLFNIKRKKLKKINNFFINI